MLSSHVSLITIKLGSALITISKWEGRYFISDEIGGYQEEARLLDQEKKWVLYIGGETLKNSEKLNRLTLILALGVVIPTIYYLIEIIKHHASSIDLEVLTSLIVLTIGIGIGIITTLIILEVLQRKSKQNP